MQLEWSNMDNILMG